MRKISFLYAGTIISKLIALLAFVYVNKKLEVEELGVLVGATIFFQFITAVSSFGFHLFFYQYPDKSEELNTVKSYSFLYTGLSYFILGLVALIVSCLVTFGEGLRLFLIIYSINIMFQGIVQFNDVILKKEQRFEELSVLNVTRDFMLSGLKIILLYVTDWGVLCIPISDVGARLSKLGLGLYRTKYFPLHYEKNAEIRRRALSFGSFSFLSGVTSFFNTQMDTLFVVSFFQAHTIGLYNFAKQLSRMPHTYVVAPITGMITSNLIKYKNTPAFHELIYNISEILILIMMPVYIYLFLNTEVIVVEVFDPKWLASAMYVRVFVAALMFSITYFTLTPVLECLGEVKSLAKLKIVRLIGLLVIISSALYWFELSFYHYLLLIVGSNVLLYFPQLILSLKKSGIKFSRYAMSIARSIVILIPVVLFCFFVRNHISNLNFWLLTLSYLFVTYGYLLFIVFKFRLSSYELAFNVPLTTEIKQKYESVKKKLKV